MGSSIRDFLQQSSGQRREEEQPSNFMRWLEGQESVDRVNAAATHNASQTPDRAARMLRLQAKTGLPRDFIERNLDELEREAGAADFDPEVYRRSSPRMLDWISEHPDHLAAVGPDLSRLNYLERQIRSIRAHFQEGKDLTELSRIGERAILGTVTPEDRTRQMQLQERMGRAQEDYGITGFFEGIPGAVANQLPIFGQMFMGKIKGAAAGGAVGAAGGAAVGAAGAAIGGQLGPQVAAPEEIVTVPAAAAAGALRGGGKGAALGWRYGSAIEAARLEASLAFLEYEDMVDENGEKLDRTTALGAAAIVGLVNGGLEMVGFESMLQSVPGVRALSRPSVARALRSQTTRRAFQRYARVIGESMVTEGLTEFMQSMTQSIGGELAIMAQDGSLGRLSTGAILDRLFSDEALQQAAMEARMGAQAGGGMSAGAGSVSLAIDIRRARAAEANGQIFEEIGTTVAESELIERLPEAMQEAVKFITADGPLQDVYSPIETWNEYWQQAGLDPEEVAAEVVGDDGAAYREAVRTGGDLAIPTARYAVTIARSEHNAFFADELRAQPLEMNRREARELMERLKKEEQQEAVKEEVVNEESGKVRDAIAVMLESTGMFDPAEIEPQAAMYEQVFSTMSQRIGGKVSPLELLERYGLDISFSEGPESISRPETVLDQDPETFDEVELEEFEDRRDPNARPSRTDKPDRIEAILEQLEEERRTLAAERGGTDGTMLPGHNAPISRDVDRRLREIEAQRRQLAAQRAAENPELYGAEIDPETFGERVKATLEQIRNWPRERAEALRRAMRSERTRGDRTLFQGAHNENVPPLPFGFHSKLERLAATRLGRRATIAQIRSLQKDVKAEEWKWVEMDELIDRLQGDGDDQKVVDTSEVLQAIMMNRLPLKVEPIASRRDEHEANERYNEIVEDYVDLVVDQLYDGYDRYMVLEPGETLGSLDEATIRQRVTFAVMEDPAIREEVEEEIEEEFENESEVYEQYTLPGGDNYRELGLVLPTLEYVGGHFIDKRGLIAWLRVKDRVLPNGKKILFIEEIQSDLHQDARKKGGYRGEEEETRPENYKELDEQLTDLHREWAEWFGLVQQRGESTTDEKNAAKFREFQERFRELYTQIGDRDMVLSYYIRDLEEELIRLEGLQDGYESAIKNDLYSSEQEKVEAIQELEKVRAQMAEAQARVAEFVHEREQVRDAKARPPQAPFKAFHEIMMKQAIAIAARDGYDGVAWTRGQHQIERYDLRNYFDEMWLDTAPNQRGYIALTVLKDGERIKDDYIKDSELEEYVGRGLAEELRNAPLEEYSSIHGFEPPTQRHHLRLSEAASVGGEGMEAFYDNILPKFVDKFVKKFGGKVENVVIDLMEFDRDRERVEDFYTSIRGEEQRDPSDTYELTHGVMLTPELKEAALGQTFELYQPAFHGSPFLFDKFETRRIGTGEGAQSFGWGLYFTQSREIAEFYRGKLTGLPNLVVKGVEFNHSQSSNNRLSARAAWLANPNNPDAQRKYAEAEAIHYMHSIGSGKSLSTLKQHFKEIAEGTHPRSWASTSSDWMDRKPDGHWQRAYEYVNRLKDKDVKWKSRGRLYKVDIPEDSDMLHWDLPIGEQPAAVAKAIQTLGLIRDPSELHDWTSENGVWTGEELYRLIVEMVSEGEFEGHLPDALHLSVDHAFARSVGVDPNSSDDFVDAIVENAPQYASRLLAAVGVKGIKYADGATRTLIHGSAADRANITYNFVVFDDKLVKILDYEQENRRNQPRGRIRIGGSEINIELFKNADLSTFLHETGHFYLEMLEDLALGPDSTEQLARDYAIVRTWLGVPEGELIQTEHHEKFARGFEAYLMEGKAPTPALRSAFARFRQWLMTIYKSISQLDVELSDDIRGVFDRLLATDEEIAAAQHELGAEPLFQDPEAIGMTEKQAAEYREAIEEAKQAASETLTQKVMAEVKREQTRRYKAAKAKVTEEVGAEVDQDPTMRALSILQRGRLPSGAEVPEALQKLKLSRDAILGDYGHLSEANERPEAFMRRFPRPRIYSRKDGVHPEQAAELLGFDSGDALLRAMLGITETPRDMIDRLVAERMAAEHGDLLTDGTLPDEAMAAIHSDKRAYLLRKELEHLARNDLPALKGLLRKVTRRVPPIAEVRATAQDIISSKRVRDVKPGTYQRAEARSAKLALEALLRGDIEAAFEEKQRELLNHELYRAAIAAREEADKIRDYMQKFAVKKVRERLAKAGGEYLAQIDAIRDRYSFAQVPLKDLDQRQSLFEFIQAQEDAGTPITVPEKLINEARRINWRETTMSELRGIHETAQQIEHLARLKNRLLANKRTRDVQQAVDEIVASITANHKLRDEPFDFAPGMRQRLKENVKGVVAAHTKMEFLFNHLDGHEMQGPTWQHLFKPFADAESQENLYRREVVSKLKDIFSVYPRNERATWFWKKISVPGINASFTKANLLAVALNWGNVYNRDALMKGYGWNETQVQQLLDQLDKRDWDTVQSIWNLLNEYWPEIAKLESELNGLPPEKVEATPVQTRFGEYEGGYYPIVFDSRLSWRQAVLEARQNVRDVFGGGWVRAMTKHGHTKERTDTGGKPLLLELSGLTNHLTNVIHDLTHRRAVLDVYRLTQRKEVRHAIEQSVGREMYKQIHPWLVNIAADKSEFSNPIESLLSRARMGATVVSMGWKMTTALVQFMGYTNSVNELGLKYSALGLDDVYRKPWEIKDNWEFITSRSPFMLDRMTSYDRDVRDTLRRLNVAGVKAGPLSAVGIYTSGLQESWFILTGLMDMAVAMPTWLGAYRKAMDGEAEGIASGDENAAVDYADQIVRMTQGTGAAKDLAAVQRGHEVFRLFTMFYTFFAVLFNQFMKAGQQFQRTKNVPRLVASLFLLWFIPAALSDVLVGRGPDDPDEDDAWLKFFLERTLTYPFQTIVLLRDIVNGMGRYGYSPSAAFDAFDSLARSSQAVGEAVFTEEELTESDVKAIVHTTGYFMRLPTRQLWITGEYFHSWMTGETSPDNPIDALWHGLVTGTPDE